MAGARAVASPTITWGLVSVPCKAYLASSSESLSFHMLSPKKNRVKMQFIDAVTGEVVDKGICTKGYEYEKGKSLELTEEDLKCLDGEKNNYIEIESITSDINLSPERIEKAYYLAPDKSDRSYKLLVKCLNDMKKVAVAKFFTRGRDHLVALAPAGDTLMMLQLYYAPEVRECPVSIGKNNEPSDKEVELGKMLMAQLGTEFNFNSYKDEYSSKVEAAIARKLNGEKLESVKQEVKAVAFDLAALLESSLKVKKEK